MAIKIAVHVIVGALVLSTAQAAGAVGAVKASVPLQVPVLDGSHDILLPAAQMQTIFEQSHDPISNVSNYQNLLAADPFDSAKWKTTFERDPNFLAWATRLTPFWQFLVENDLIGMSRDKVTELLGPGQKVEDSTVSPADSASADEKARPGYLLVTRISGAKLVSTCFQLEFKDDKVTQWRFFSSENHYPISSPDKVFRMDLVAPWVKQNVVESDICDFGLKIKKTLGFANPDKTNDSFEDSRPPFEVAQQKVLPTTEEPLALILLQPQPTFADYLNSAILCQQSLLVKASRDYTLKALAVAKTDADRKKARAFLESRLPHQTPPWPIEKRHLESYAASKRKEPESAISGYEKNIRECPTFEYSYYMVGMLKREQKNYAGAKLMFEEVVKRNPKYQKALFGLATIKMESGETNVARKMALQAYFLYPYDSSAKSIYRSVTNEDPPKEQPAGLYAGEGKAASQTKKH